ncbi:PTS galactitol transporter subunit IIC [Salmonella enterica]|uniref:PTS galactitol transporter subunit IIC n=2 Tax=Salmonella enterica TaxID=28901 RepID=A0A5Y2SJ00_SALHO|nr:PTS galactitol transporter subunit IIC [Salmonella enterica]ECF6076515.1 PTS galactitol transporter subunit IIC [Salmonella enterica subsp. houtenae]EDO5298266.1 PTS galactitol transporter subunit IIC [Salmonella enterica subsp. houtenae serovar 40:z4,z24:-]EDS6441781.1 PTS galactitol transporter subunit IIC [Salmonella enterica subsp. VII str. CFSAN000550]QJY68512.1 PTS galactitol transporter subunit IIC [Salmonella enterica subsp. VII serovar 1,40:g,z51:--]QUZ23522.1 PTS galactitol transp
MDFLGVVINYVLNLGAPVFVPFIMLLAGLVVRMKFRDAASAAITLGVAFVGMSMLIGFMVDAIGVAAQTMMNRTGLELSIVDGGWTTMANISWAWPYAFVMFPLQVGVNIVMLMLNKTNTFNADLWNVWGKIFTAFIVVSVATPLFGPAWSLILAFLIAAFQIIVELNAGDIHQHRIEKLTGIPGVTCTHRMVFFGAIYYPFDLLLRKIPVCNKPMDATALRAKVGVFAENHIIGFILGILFGVIAGYSVAKTLMLGVQAATALVLFPMISKLFMQALSPISEAISDYMNKKFSGRKLFVGIDWPFMGGASEIWFAIIVAIPFTLIWALILPGNKILPFAGIINIALIVPAYLVTRGNTLRMVILSIIGIPFFLFVGTQFAPMITELGQATKAIAIPAGQLISNSSIDAPVFTYAFSFLFKLLEGNFIPLIFAIWWGCGYFFYSRELRRESSLEQQEAEQQEKLQQA